MSHVVAGEVLIDPKHLDCLVAAIAEIPGLHFRENQKEFKWFGSWVNDYDAKDAAYKLGIKTEDYGKCDHAISVDGSGYEIGLMKCNDANGNPTGKYRLVYDFWGTGKVIRDLVGSQSEGLCQRYGANVAAKLLKQKGYTVTKETVGKKIVVKATSYAGLALIACHVLAFDGNKYTGVYSDQLPDIGMREITRASSIEFNNTTNKWEVRFTETPNVVSYSDTSREACVSWEIAELQRRMQQ